MTTMDDGQKAIIKTIAQEVGKELMEQYEKTLTQQIERHRLTCATAAEVNKWKNQGKAVVIGIAIGAAIVGSAGTVGILKLFTYI